MTTRNGAVPQNKTNFSFTDRRLDRLKPLETGKPTNQTEYSDKVCIGLKLIQSNLTSRKNFHHRYEDQNGKKKTLKIGEYPAVNVELARKITNENKALLAQGLDPVQERKNQREKLTFQQFVEKIYLPDAMTRKKSWKDDKRKLDKDMYRAFGEKIMTDITKGDVTQYINSIRSRTSNSTANRHRALLSSIMNMAIDHEMLVTNNVQHIKKLPESSEHGRKLTDEELPRLLNALASARNQVSVLAIKLMLATGMRKTECLQLEWSNIDFVGRVAKLEEGKTKGNRAHNPPLNDFAIATLRELEKLREADNPYLFPGKDGKPLTTVRKTFESCKKIAGIENFRLHDSRHNFITRLSEAGIPLSVIQQLVGHRSPAMTQRYTHLSADTLQAASQIASSQLVLAVAA